jgi:hypothetical protein
MKLSSGIVIVAVLAIARVVFGIVYSRKSEKKKLPNTFVTQRVINLYKRNHNE